jgi:hypothetical protein
MRAASRSDDTRGVQRLQSPSVSQDHPPRPPDRSFSDRTEPLGEDQARRVEVRLIAAPRRRRWPGDARALRSAILSYAALGALPEASRAERPDVHSALAALVDLSRPYAEQKDTRG